MISNRIRTFVKIFVLVLLCGTAVRQVALASISGAIYTSLGDGTVVNQNRYPAKADVYLNGGPQNPTGSGLSPLGTYYFQVTDPSGNTVLSTDPAACRQVVVAQSSVSGKGVILGVPAGPAPEACTGAGGNWHAVGTPNALNGSLPVQLIPYLDTPNNGGEYKVWLISQSCATPVTPSSPILSFSNNCDSKTDNFKVNAPPPTGSFTVAKRCLVEDEEVTPLGPAFQFSIGSSALLSCGGTDPQVIQTLPQTITVMENASGPPPDPAFGWELREITCTDDNTSAVVATGTVASRTVSATVNAAHLNITCTFTNAQARMPLHKLVNGEEATCTDDPSTEEEETGDAGIRPCTYEEAELTLVGDDPNTEGVDETDPRFTMNLYFATAGDATGIPVPVPDQNNNPQTFPDGFIAQALIPPVFEAPGLIGIPLSLCEVPALPYQLDSVSIDVYPGSDDLDGDLTKDTLHPTVYPYPDAQSGYRCFNLVIPSGTTRFEIFIDNTAASLTVVKQVINPVQNPDPGIFDLGFDSTIPAGTGDNVGDGGTTGPQVVTAETGGTPHTVFELVDLTSPTSLAEYTSSVSCDNGASGSGTSLQITLNPGDKVTCTITNTRKTGYLKIIKQTLGGFGEFSFSASGGIGGGSVTVPNVTTALNANPSDTGTIQVVTGTYAVAETGVVVGSLSDWATSNNCGNTGNGLTGSVVVSTANTSGNPATCTFTNKKKPQLKVVKSLSPASDPGRFVLSINASVSGEVGDGGSLGPQQVEFGSNSVGEAGGVATPTALSDYATSISCDHGVTATPTTAPANSLKWNVVLGDAQAGATVTCTITNHRIIFACSVTQGGWGSPARPGGNNPGSILTDNWPGSVGVGGAVTTPAPGADPWGLLFNDSKYITGYVTGSGKNKTTVTGYLPAGGTPNPLNADFLNPLGGTNTGSGVFGGQVLALKLNVLLGGVIKSGYVGIGNLKVVGVTGYPDGTPVSTILADAETALSGAGLPAGFSYSSLNNLVDNLNNSYDNCQASEWGLLHLVP